MINNDTLANIKAGLVSGAFALLLGISFASFVFIGPLAPYLPFGFGLAIVSVILLRAIIARYSEILGVVPSPFVIVWIFNALMTSSVNNHLIANNLQHQVFPTALAIIVLSTLSIAVVLWLLGYFKLGNLVRYVPYPVTSGLLAGIGLSMILKGIDVIAGKPINAKNISNIVNIDLWPQILLAFGVAYIIYKLMQGELSLLLKGMIALSLVAIFTPVYLFINSPANVWFFGPIPSGRLFPPDISPSTFSDINWSEIKALFGTFLTMNFLFVLSFLVNINGIEAFLKKDINVNRELKLTGTANFFTALFGGIGGCLSTAQTIPNIMQGGTKYTSTISASILGLLVLFINTKYLNYIPKSILAGVPIFLGSMFLLEWGYRAKKRVSDVDYLLLLSIMGIGIFFGFLYAVAFGIMAAAAIFLYNYSNTDVVKSAFDGGAFQSNVKRSFAAEELLQQQGEQAYILKLQGFLFFGSAHRLLKMIKERITDSNKPPLKYLILDFALVNDLDSSATLSFSKLLELTKSHPFITLFCHANEKVIKQLEIAGYNGTTKSYFYLPDLDHALEWYENDLLKETSTTPAQVSRNLGDFLAFFNTINVSKGTKIPEKETDCFYYLVSGKVTAHLKKNNHKLVRLMTFNPGTFIDDDSFFSGNLSETTYVADEDTILVSIVKSKIDEIAKENPQIVLHFYDEMAKILSERIVSQNRTIDRLTHD